MKLSLAIQTPEFSSRSPISILSGTFTEMAEKAQMWGAEGIELMPVEPTKLNPTELLAILKDHQLKTAAVGTALLAMLAGSTLLDPDTEKSETAYHRFIQIIDFAATVDAPLVTIGGFRGRFSALPGEGRTRLVEILRQAGNYAQSRGIRIVLEPINRYQSDGITTIKDGLLFLEEVEHSEIGLLVDTCHMVMEETSWDEPLRQIAAAGKLWHVHIADSNRRYPGQGFVDFPTIISTLNKLGYDQSLVMEILALPDPDTAAREGLAYMQSLLGKN